MKIESLQDERQRADAEEVLRIFESLVGASNIETHIEQVGTQTFLKLVTGRPAPVYDFALQELRRRLKANAFAGLVGLSTQPSQRFPASVEASALAILLARATRPVSQGTKPEGFVVPYVPFQNKEDHKVAQPATQLIVGRRGVGKSTLIMRARELLAVGKDLSSTLDMQAYSELSGPELCREILCDLFRGILEAATTSEHKNTKAIQGVQTAISTLSTPGFEVHKAAPQLRRALASLTKSTGGQVYFFLDDFHLIQQKEQPSLLQLLHGVVKGANGWLKVAGLRSLLNYYDPTTRKGLQLPGDAQLISLDLTLENPQAAERHLSAILGTFMLAVGYPSYSSVLPSDAFRRLVWANAGVPRDFLQMFARSLEHASKTRNASITLGDINLAIGEFGQRKMDEMQEDARNEEGRLRKAVDYLLEFCLQVSEPRVNAFLVRATVSRERSIITTLSDLRLLHLIHQSITPNRAGETYQAYILDYSLFTGFRRKRNVKEMLPVEGEQFRAAVLRRLPKLPSDFLRIIEDAAGTSATDVDAGSGKQYTEGARSDAPKQRRVARKQGRRSKNGSNPTTRRVGKARKVAAKVRGRKASLVDEHRKRGGKTSRHGKATAKRP